MRRYPFLPTLMLGAFLAIGCSSEAPPQEAMADEAAEMDDHDMGEVEAGTVSARGLEGCYLANGSVAESQERPSPLKNVEFTFANGEGQLCYGAPSAKGRTVMGELVPFGSPWRAGANEPTLIHLTAPASIGGVALEPGTYSIYAEPGETEWRFYINENWQRWGIPIDAAVRSTEVGSFAAEPEQVGAMVETLAYRYEPNAENTMGDIVLEWEDTRVRFHVHPGEM